ncbi:MAG: cytochrome c oxidase accessory protein CcoG [bacterium]|nr:cytochrome c oxidase accessory protein CcoG [bacterium]
MGQLKLTKAFKGLQGFHGLRQIVMVALTVVSLALPFIKINGNHLFLLSFVHQRFEFLGLRFESQELFLIPLLLLIGAVFLFFITSLGGRVFCGWSCPQTLFRMIFRDWILFRMLRLGKVADKNQPLKLKHFSAKLRYALAVVIWAALALLAAANLLWYFVEPKEFIHALQWPEKHQFLLGLWLGLAAFLVASVVWFKEGFCKYACPYARIQSVFFDEKTPVILYDHKRGDNPDGSKGRYQGTEASGDCTDCLACVKACPTGIDIREGLQLGCVACLDCVDACVPQMAKKDKPGLIHWTTEEALNGSSVQLLRRRTVFYLALLLAAFGVLFYRSMGSEPILLNVNRNTELFAIRHGQVENHLTLLVTNKNSRSGKFRVLIKDDPKLKLLRPRQEFFIAGGEQVRKTLVIQKMGPLPKGRSPFSQPMTLLVNGPGAMKAEVTTVFISPGP